MILISKDIHGQYGGVITTKYYLLSSHVEEFLEEYLGAVRVDNNKYMAKYGDLDIFFKKIDDCTYEILLGNSKNNIFSIFKLLFFGILLCTVLLLFPIVFILLLLFFIWFKGGIKDRKKK
jgi:hypothetical protein